MLIKDAKDAARRWVTEEGSRLSGFHGAFFHGSTNWLPDDEILPPASDVDIMVVLHDTKPPLKLGKFIYKDVLLEISYIAADQVQYPDIILSQSHMAGSFRTPGIIADPSGHLTQVQAEVSRNYARRRWVTRRCQTTVDKILNNLQSINQHDQFHNQVMAWLFATGVTTHVLLVAGLENPTVRKRYMAVRKLLEDYGHLDFYPGLLELLGCAEMTRERTQEHLDALSEVFDVAKTVIKTPVFFASDISDSARPIAIDGSQELIDRGFHREAIFWMVATYCRCQSVLYHDASVEVQERFMPGFRRLVADLGITSLADLQQRSMQTKAFLPSVMHMAELIMAANPDIENEE